MKSKTVGEMMTRDVECVEPATTVRDAAWKMKSMGLGSLPVCEGGRLLGVVTDREMTVRLAAEGKDPGSTSVRDIMDASPPMLREDEDAAAVPRLMEEKGAHRIFVVDREDKFCGIVSLGKVARAETAGLAGRVVKKISRPRRKATG